jgi:hypothetical protein
LPDSCPTKACTAAAPSSSQEKGGAAAAARAGACDVLQSLGT